MTTYKDISGKFVRSVGSDPSATVGEGEIWYNTSSNTFKTSVEIFAWSSGGTVPYSARQNTSFGTQTAAINCGGTPPGQLTTSAVYNGSSWTATNALNVAQRKAGVAGTSTAGLAFGGIQPSGTYSGNMQSWDGSNWSNAPANLNNGSYGIVGAGTQTSALRAGGENPSGGDAWNKTEEYNGSSWSEVNNMPAGVYNGAGGGVQTSAIVVRNTVTYEYDGTNWTTGGTLATSRNGAGSGTTSSDSSLVFGGAPTLANTELYNGTAWSNQPNMGTGRGSFTGAGTAPAGIAVQGGPPSGATNITEEFSGTATVKTLSSS